MSMLSLLHRSPVIPVVVIDDAKAAVPLAQALLDGGVSIIEITLRTEAALDAVAQIREHCPAMVVGAGTVWSADDLRASLDAGAQFIVSPGAPARLLELARQDTFPYLPGAQTATEIAAARDAGFTELKFFPAGPAGGAPALKALSAVFPDVSFCPTGGVSAANAPEYLALPSVPCVGGSWLAPAGAVAAGDFQQISEIAQDASRLAGRA